jgi:alpha-soluble NSF attachment protein
MSANDLLRRANAKASSSKGWFATATSKFEEAGDLFQQAANAFKAEGQHKAAGDAFAREAECREKCNEKVEAANAWWNAAKAYKKGHPDCEFIFISSTLRQRSSFISNSGHPSPL